MPELPAKKHKILIVSGSFPDPHSVFINTKIIELARSGNQVYVLSTYPGDKKLFRTLMTSEPDLFIKTKPSFPFNKNYFSKVYPYFSLIFKLIHAISVCPRETQQLGKLIFKDGLSRIKIIDFWRQLDLIINALPVDLIHFEWNNQATGYIEATQVVDKPIIVSIRGRGISSQPLNDMQLAKNLPVLFNRSDGIHSISSDLIEKGAKFGLNPEKVTLIPPAIDLKLFIPPVSRDYSCRPLKIVTVAHLRWKKNLLGGIQAIKVLVDLGFNIQYEIIGEGTERECLTYAINDLGLNDRVFLRGYLKHAEVIAHLAAGHLFFMPSIQEGFCNAVIEAQAMELPVVVTDAEGLKENIDENVTGLVASRWDFHEMANKLGFLLSDPELCVNFGKAGRKRAVGLFGLDQQITKFEELYTKTITEYENRGNKE